MPGASSQLDDPFAHAITFVVGVARRHRFRVALTGGFALAFHGVPRASEDVAFLVDEEGAAPLHEALTEAGARAVQRSADAASYAATLGLAPLEITYARRRKSRFRRRSVTSASGSARSPTPSGPRALPRQWRAGALANRSPVQ